MADSIFLYKGIINAYLGVMNNAVKEYSSLMELAKDSLLEIKELNKKTSEQYNPLLYFDIPEPLNSRILVDLFNPNHNHGQNDLFLGEYLKAVGVHYETHETWKVERESENADIVLSANNPVRIVVIENKINNAPDRPNQLYRYYQLKIKEYYQKTNAAANFKVVYLTRNAQKKFADHSVMSADGTDRVPEKLILRQSFKEDIKLILQNCIAKLDNENYRMKAFLHFLIEQTTT